MIDILGLKDIIYLHKVHENSRKLTTIEKKEYYQMLDKTDMNLLIEVYKQDFYLFDYNPDSWALSLDTKYKFILTRFFYHCDKLFTKNLLTGKNKLKNRLDWWKEKDKN